MFFPFRERQYMTIHETEFYNDDFSDPSIPELILLNATVNAGEAVLLDAEELVLLDAGECVLLDTEDLVLLDTGERLLLDAEELVLLDAGEAVLLVTLL